MAFEGLSEWGRIKGANDWEMLVFSNTISLKIKLYNSFLLEDFILSIKESKLYINSNTNVFAINLLDC